MRIENKMKMTGEFYIEARDAATGALVWSKGLKNMLMRVNRDVRVQMLTGAYAGDGSEFEIKYFAIGTGGAAPTLDDTQLAAEVFRKQVTQLTVADGTVTSIVSIGANEANYVIREIGVFCGSSATEDANTGLMISRVAVFVDKNTNLVLNIIRKDICTI